MVKHWVLKGYCFIGIILCLAGCSGGDDDLQAFIEEVRSRPGKPIEPVPTYKPTKRFAYPIKPNRRNPFYSRTSGVKKTDSKKKKNVVGAPDQRRPKQPLEAFPLDALKMVGILKENGTIWGLVSAPNGTVYKVTVGIYMGKHYGRVTRVSDNYIRLIETIKEGEKWKKKQVVIKLETNKVNDNKAMPK